MIHELPPERRAEKNLPIGDIASVASFFVSRIDTAVDALLSAKIKTSTDTSERARLTGLLGKIAIANAKILDTAAEELRALRKTYTVATKYWDPDTGEEVKAPRLEQELL